MKTLRWKVPAYLAEDPRWGADVDRIVEICEMCGYTISKADAKHAWEQHSDDMAEIWLFLDEDDNDTFQAVLSQCEVIEDGI